MEVQFIGASVRKGTAQKTGRPYTIGELLYMVPDESGTRKDDDGNVIWNYVAHGCKVRKVDIDPSKISVFKDVVPGSKILVQLEPKPENPTENHVVGLK